MNQFPKSRNSNTSRSVNHRKHPFYLDQQNNSLVPTWFIECSRQEAESLLTVRQDDGNVLMRPSQQNPYALTIRTVVNGIGKFNHYAVQRNNRGEFFMDIDNPHSPVPSLSQVIELFIQLAGQTNHRAFGASRTAVLQKLSPTVSNPPPGIRQRSINPDTSNMLSRVAPVISLHKRLGHCNSTNPYVDRPRTVERTVSRPDYLHIQSTGGDENLQHDDMGDYLHTAVDVDTAADNSAGHYLTLTDEEQRNLELLSPVAASDYLIVTGDDVSTTTTLLADNSEQQTTTTTTTQQQTSGYLTLRDETDDQQTDNNNVYDKPKTSFSETKNPVANYLNLDAQVKPLCNESDSHTPSRSLSKCGIGASFNSNAVYESPRPSKPDYVNLSAGVSPPSMNGHQPSLQPRKPKPPAVAPDYLKAYVPEDHDLPNQVAPPPPSIARRSPPAVTGNDLRGSEGSPACPAGGGVRGPGGHVTPAGAGGRGGPAGGGVRGRGGPITPPRSPGGRGAPGIVR